VRLIKPAAKERPDDYRDPPSVVARQQRILARWKAEGRVINQPRMAISLAIARQGEKHKGDSKWGDWMHRHDLALRRNALFATLGYYNLKRALVARRRNAELRKFKVKPKDLLANPYALPEKPMVRSGQTL
jgi:hypothetical protein